MSFPIRLSIRTRVWTSPPFILLLFWSRPCRLWMPNTMLRHMPWHMPGNAMAHAMACHCIYHGMPSHMPSHGTTYSMACYGMCHRMPQHIPWPAGAHGMSCCRICHGTPCHMPRHYHGISWHKPWLAMACATSSHGI